MIIFERLSFYLPIQTTNELKSGSIIKYKDGPERKKLISPLIAEERTFTGESNFSQTGIIEIGIGRSAADKTDLPQRLDSR